MLHDTASIWVSSLSSFLYVVLLLPIHSDVQRLINAYLNYLFLTEDIICCNIIFCNKDLVSLCFYFSSCRETTHGAFISLSDLEPTTVPPPQLTSLSNFSLQPLCSSQSFFAPLLLSNLGSDHQHVPQQLRSRCSSKFQHLYTRLDQWDSFLNISACQP